MADAAARDAAPARGLRREHGGGLAALRRQRLRAPGRHERARHQDRAQEHELVPLPRAGHQRRDRAPGGAARGGRAGRARRRCTSTRASGALTPLRSKEEAHDYRYFPEPDLVPVAPSPRRCSRPRAPALPELPAARAERYERDSGWRPTPPACSRSGASWATTSSAAAPPATAPSRGDRQLGRRRARRAPAATPTRRTSKVAPGGARRAGRARRRPRRSTARRRAAGARPAGRRGRRPGGDRRGEGLGAMGDDDELAGDRRRARSTANPDVVERIRGGNAKAIGALVGPSCARRRAAPTAARSSG